jgi:hypothetical protein
MSALDDLVRVCRTLGADPLSPVEAADAIGTISEDHGPDLPIELVPALPAFMAAKVVREFGAEEVAHVSLTLKEPMALGPLAARFGDGKRAHDVSMHAPRTMTFKVPQPDLACDCAVIAQLRRIGEEDFAVGFSVRRDKR